MKSSERLQITSYKGTVDRQSHPIQTVYLDVRRSTWYGTSLPRRNLRTLFWHSLTF